MSGRRVAIGVAAALVCLLFATVSTSGGVDLWGEPQWDPSLGDRDPIEFEVSPTEEAALEEPDVVDDDPIELPPWLVDVLQVLLVGVAAAVIAALALAGWRRRPRVRWRRHTTDDFEVLPDVAAAVVEQAAAQRATLLDGAPRNAIVQCWLQLEQDVAAAGLARDPADTSLEFTERVLARYAVDDEAIIDLAARYREARFSDHPLDESHRDAALAALDRLHRTLSAARLAAANSADDDSMLGAVR